MGGFSSEREVSLVSGKQISKALKTSGYTVLEHDLKDMEKFIQTLQEEKPDVVFNALHGNWGEDGEIQALLDCLQIPYTHSSMTASNIGMNKWLTKQICLENNIKTAKYEKTTFARFKKSGTKIAFPYVIKPVSDGSSVGVFIVHNKQDEEKVCYDDNNKELLVEKYIPGQEITVAVLNGKSLAVTELRPNLAFYDYEAKYTAGATTHILPADLPQDIYQTAMEYALQIHNLLGCHCLSRSDFRYNKKDGVVFLEINTNPGMTPLSLVPEQAKYNGISYEQLCTILVESAQCRKI